MTAGKTRAARLVALLALAALLGACHVHHHGYGKHRLGTPHYGFHDHGHHGHGKHGHGKHGR